MTREPRPRIDRSAGVESRARRAGAPGEAGARSLRRIEAPVFYVFAVVGARGGRLSPLDCSVLAASRQLVDAGAGAVIAVAGAELGPQLADVGADRRIEFSVAAASPEYATGALTALCARYAPRHVLFADDCDGRDRAARLASRLDADLIRGVHSLTAHTALRRSGCGRHDLARAPAMIMTVMEGAATLNKSERYEALVLGAELPGSVASMVEDLGVRRLAADKAPLEEAPLVIGAGAGVSAWSAFASVAASLHAATACTRVISDQRLMSRERQVGASGRTIAADCYLAFGVSGALQHLQGIEACARVVAVNTDPHAAMIKRADLAVIADANDVLIALQRLLERNACN